jgi:prepilin-type N-terminal cleavage/methylation domain-containing protein
MKHKKNSQVAFTPFRNLQFLTGFTLIELIVVVVIMGILAGIMVPKYMQAKERAIDKQAKAILCLIRAAEINYARDTGSFYGPDSIIAISSINSNLGLELADNGNWVYKIWTQQDETYPPPNHNLVYVQTLRAVMCRNGGGVSRSWYINLNSTNIGNVTVNPTRTEEWLCTQ